MKDSETDGSKCPANLICSAFPKEYNDLPVLSKYFQRIYYLPSYYDFVLQYSNET